MTRSGVLPGKLKRLLWILASAIIILAVIGCAWLQRASTPQVPGAFYTLPDPLPECATGHQANPFRFISAVNLMVREGFMIVATDYPGRGTAGIHPYLIGPIAARAVLDSVRVVRQLDVNAGERYAIFRNGRGGF